MNNTRQPLFYVINIKIKLYATGNREKIPGERFVI